MSAGRRGPHWLIATRARFAAVLVAALLVAVGVPVGTLTLLAHAVPATPLAGIRLAAGDDSPDGSSDSEDKGREEDKKDDSSGGDSGDSSSSSGSGGGDSSKDSEKGNDSGSDKDSGSGKDSGSDKDSGSGKDSDAGSGAKEEFPGRDQAGPGRLGGVHRGLGGGVEPAGRAGRPVLRRLLLVLVPALRAPQLRQLHHRPGQAQRRPAHP